MAPPPLDTQFNPETKIWSGPEEGHDNSLQLGAYFLKVLKNAENPDKIVQVEYYYTQSYIIIIRKYLFIP